MTLQTHPICCRWCSKSLGSLIQDTENISDDAFLTWACRDCCVEHGLMTAEQAAILWDQEEEEECLET